MFEQERPFVPQPIRPKNLVNRLHDERLYLLKALAYDDDSAKQELEVNWQKLQQAQKPKK